MGHGEELFMVLVVLEFLELLGDVCGRSNSLYHLVRVLAHRHNYRCSKCCGPCVGYLAATLVRIADTRLKHYPTTGWKSGVLTQCC